MLSLLLYGNSFQTLKFCSVFLLFVHTSGKEKNDQLKASRP